MILLIDTAQPTCFLTVIAENGERQEYAWEANRTLAKGLLAFLQEKTGNLKTISGIGIMKGPGSFTGLRIGLTVMNTLADSLRVPIVGEVGELWQDRALERLRNKENERIVLPLYGAEAYITQPRK